MKTMEEKLQAGLDAALKAVGTGAALAKKLGIRKEAIYQWSAVPVARVVAVEEATGVPRATLRPDLFEEK